MLHGAFCQKMLGLPDVGRHFFGCSRQVCRAWLSTNSTASASSCRPPGVCDALAGGVESRVFLGCLWGCVGAFWSVLGFVLGWFLGCLAVCWSVSGVWRER